MRLCFFESALVHASSSKESLTHLNVAESGEEEKKERGADEELHFVRVARD